MTLLLIGKLLHKAAQNRRARVALGIHRMTHTVNQTGMIECILVQEPAEILSDLLLVLPVVHPLLHIVKHLNNLDIRAAVLRPLQRAERRCHGRIGIRTGGRYNMHRKARVIAAAVLCMQHHCKIENLCFELRVFLITAQHAQQVFCRRKIRVGLMQEETLVILVIAVCLIAVDRNRRELRDQLDALTQDIGD